MKTQTVIFALAAAVLAGCGKFNNIESPTVVVPPAPPVVIQPAPTQ